LPENQRRFESGPIWKSPSVSSNGYSGILFRETKRTKRKTASNFRPSPWFRVHYALPKRQIIIVLKVVLRHRSNFSFSSTLHNKPRKNKLQAVHCSLHLVSCMNFWFSGYHSLCPVHKFSFPVAEPRTSKLYS
jgi:hypothetical protein